MIDIRNLSVSYRGSPVPALSSLSLNISGGEYVAVMGPNGSGKSTLIKALCGLIAVADGQINMLEKAVHFGTFGDDFFGRVGVVFQEPEGQFLMHDVQTEITSILQNLGLSIQQQKERFDKIISRFELTNIINQKPENLSGGQMQAVNLACALAMEPDILLLDEPITYLDRFYQRKILGYLDQFHLAGKTIVHITQNSEEATRADRICILDSGRLAADIKPSEFTRDPDSLIRYNIVIPVEMSFMKQFGFKLADDSAARAFCDKLKPRPAMESYSPDVQIRREPIFSINKLIFHYDKNDFKIKIDDLNLHKNGIIGLIGATGSGKSTLALLLAGLVKPDSGQIEYGGKTLGNYPIKELRRKIGISWQLSDLAMIGPTVKDDIDFIAKNLELKNLNLPAILEQVGLNGFEERIVDTLSGGEKRKLSMAGLLAADPEFVILDEPTAFLDPQSRKELETIIIKMTEEGRGIIIAGHDLQFISKLTDRILGIKDGEIILDLPAADFFSEGKYLKLLDLPPDPIIEFKQILVERGHHLPFASLDPKLIKAYLEGIMPEER